MSTSARSFLTFALSTVTAMVTGGGAAGKGSDSDSDESDDDDDLDGDGEHDGNMADLQLMDKAGALAPLRLCRRARETCPRSPACAA